MFSNIVNFVKRLIGFALWGALLPAIIVAAAFAVPFNHPNHWTPSSDEPIKTVLNEYLIGYSDPAPARLLCTAPDPDEWDRVLSAEVTFKSKEVLRAEVTEEKDVEWSIQYPGEDKPDEQPLGECSVIKVYTGTSTTKATHVYYVMAKDGKVWIMAEEYAQEDVTLGSLFKKFWNFVTNVSSLIIVMNFIRLAFLDYDKLGYLIRNCLLIAAIPGALIALIVYLRNR